MLSVGGEVNIFQLVAGEALMSAGVDVVEDGHCEAEQSVHVDLVRCETCGGAHSIVVREHDVACTKCRRRFVQYKPVRNVPSNRFGTFRPADHDQGASRSRLVQKVAAQAPYSPPAGP